MLGTLLDKWDKSKSVDIKKGDSFLIVRGKRLEVKLEENNYLRLSQVKIEENRDEQWNKANVEFMNILKQRRKDFVLLKEDLKNIRYKLDNDELDAEIEEDLEQQARKMRIAKKKCAKEIAAFEAKTTITVNYSQCKTGLTALLPPGLIVHPKFLVEPVC